MSYVPPGTGTSAVEVSNVSKHGFWLLISGRELFVPFSEFPWFLEAPIGKLLDVQAPHEGHLHWPQLDIDLAVESIEHPERYPLVSNARARVAQPEDRKGAARPIQEAGDTKE